MPKRAADTALLAIAVRRDGLAIRLLRGEALTAYERELIIELDSMIERRLKLS